MLPGFVTCSMAEIALLTNMVNPPSIRRYVLNFKKLKLPFDCELLAHVLVRVCVGTSGRDSAVPSIFDSPIRTDPIATDAVPIAAQPINSTACEKLVANAAQTTLRVVEFKPWNLHQDSTFSRMPSR